MRIINWNMLGGTNSVESKWTTGVSMLFNKAQADVVCLQESGAPSGSTVPLPPPPWIGAAPVKYNYYLWTPFKQSYHVLWVQTEPGGNRVNLSICCVVAPVALLLSPPGFAKTRPAIGMRVFGTDVFSLHGLSGSGNDVPGLIRNIAATTGGPGWQAAGDYNREPTSWAAPAGIICPPNRATFPASDSKFDYMVDGPGNFQIGWVMEEFVYSDHYPVIYDV